MRSKIKAVILAGDRPGGSKLATVEKVKAGVLVELRGKPCIQHVIEALRASKSISGGTVVGPKRDKIDKNKFFRMLMSSDDYDWCPPGDGPSQSAFSTLLNSREFPILLTAGDHPLLTPAAIDDFCSEASQLPVDFVVGLVPSRIVKNKWPLMKRTWYHFSDGEFCGSNLFLVNHPAGLKVLKFWSSVESHRKTPWKIARKISWTKVIQYLLKRLSLSDCLQTISEMTGASVSSVEIKHAAAAVDVDSSADMEIARQVLNHDRR